MKHILGIVGHPDTNTGLRKEINNHFDDIEIIEVGVSNDPDILFIRKSIRLLENKSMGILFTDKGIYQLFHSITKISINSTYLENHKPEILKTLFKANNRNDMNVLYISTDSITYD